VQYNSRRPMQTTAEITFHSKSGKIDKRLHVRQICKITVKVV